MDETPPTTTTGPRGEEDDLPLALMGPEERAWRAALGSDTAIEVQVSVVGVMMLTCSGEGLPRRAHKDPTGKGGAKKGGHTRTAMHA